MLATDQFRRQHLELVALASELTPMLSAEELPRRLAECRVVLARFLGKLRVHGAMENEALYPRLFEHEDSAVRSKARALFEEVGGIYGRFEEFSARWATAEAIAANPAEFAREVRQLLRILGLRMQRENQELYPLVDAAEET